MAASSLVLVQRLADALADPVEPAVVVRELVATVGAADGQLWLLAAEGEAPTAELAEAARDGEPVLRPTSAALPLRVGSRLLGAVGLVFSAERQYDEEDRLLLVTLAQQCALALARAEASQAVRMRDDFLSVAGHELRTPLTALLAHLGGLQVGGFSEARSAEKLEASLRQVRRLAKLTDDLLDVSRVLGGRLLLQPEMVDLGELAREVAARAADEAQRLGVIVTVQVEGEVRGHWDRLRIDQVLTNLLANALRYGEHHPVEISLSAEAAQVRCEVRDHGPGIDPLDHQRIFERFERAGAIGAGANLGLGLWISRQIVEAHGGRLSVDSAPGRGATFIVELPLPR